MQQPEVIHDPASDRFFLSAEDAEVVVRYQMIDSQTMNIVSTYTPPELRRRGLARTVVEFALDHATANKLNVQASCWYANRILHQRREEEE